MCLVRLHIIGSVAINVIFSLKWIHYCSKEGILDHWGYSYFRLLLYYIIEKDKGYRVETMDMDEITMTRFCQWYM